MEKIGTKYREQVKLIGYMGIGVGFLGMIFILYSLFQNLYHVITVPTAQSGISLVIPGVKIPGSPLTPPLIIGWIALFAVILVHEFSHGVVSIAHHVKVKSSGIVFFGPLMGAFVEPDEKEMAKKHETAQYSIFAAGPWSNVILALCAMLLLSFAVAPTIDVLTTPTGFSVSTVQDGYPAQLAGLPNNTLITAINNVTITDAQGFVNVLSKVSPKETVVITGDKEYTITTVAHPDDTTKAYLGISGFENQVTHTYPGIFSTIGLAILQVVKDILSWIGLLSLGIGLANLLPLGPVDGGRMMGLASEKIHGEKKGKKVWVKISGFVLLLLLVNLFWPAISWLIGKL